jgi:hypothetical protein
VCCDFRFFESLLQFHYEGLDPGTTSVGARFI